MRSGLVGGLLAGDRGSEGAGGGVTRTLSTSSAYPPRASGAPSPRFRGARGAGGVAVAVAVALLALVSFVTRNVASTTGWRRGGDDEDAASVVVVQPAATGEEGKEEEEPHLVMCLCAHFSNQSRLLPPPTAVQEVIPRLIAGHLTTYPELAHVKVVYRHIYGKPSHLPPHVNMLSAEGRRMIGLDGCHLRYCQFGGASDFVKVLLAQPGVKLCTRRRGQGLDEGWSPDQRMFVPPHGVSVPCDEHNRTLPPLVIRHSMEQWYDGTHLGVGAQIETKRENLGVSVTWFLPNVVYHTAEVFGEDFHNILRRKPEFNPAAVRLAKTRFAVMVQSNCGDKTSFTSWNRFTIVRELFTYALHRVAALPVHNLGRCPLGTDGAERAGVTVQEREHLKTTLGGRDPVTALGQKFRIPNRAVYEQFKFAIVFENGPSPGYATDRLMNAWMSETVPVYWGGPMDSYRDVYDQRGYIHCQFPENATMNVGSSDYFTSVTKRFPQECGANVQAPACTAAFRGEVEALLAPHLEACAREVVRVHLDDAAYDAMLASPVVPFSMAGAAGRPNPGGVWDMRRFGEMVAATYVGLGYEVPPAPPS